jgi:hypothetical protein
VALVGALGVTQIFAWGSSYYLPAAVADAVTAEMNVSLAWTTAGLSVGLLVAGTVSPRVGRMINQRGGRLVLAGSSVLLGLGLICLGSAGGPLAYMTAWIIMGMGMGAGLYDAVFSTLGRLYGPDAREAISALTLIAGFSSTICWPLSSYLLDHIDWRNTCFVYAAIQFLVALPIHFFVLPSQHAGIAMPGDVGGTRLVPTRGQRHLFLVLAAVFTIAGMISTIISIHILSMLQDRGNARLAAVAIGSLIGPSQVAARLVEVVFGQRYHALWTLAGSVALTTVGVVLLLFVFPPAALAVILYGAGTGIGWIARGTVPLALFDVGNYAELMGRLALPSTISMALAPFIAAVVIQLGGSRLMLSILVVMTLTNVVLVSILFRKTRISSMTRSTHNLTS